MGIFSLLGWIIYGLIVGILGKVVAGFIVPNIGKTVPDTLPTILYGVAGSFVGGFINYLMGNGTEAFSSSGWIMGIIGAAVALISYNFIRNKLSEK